MKIDSHYSSFSFLRIHRGCIVSSDCASIGRCVDDSCVFSIKTASSQSMTICLRLDPLEVKSAMRSRIQQLRRCYEGSELTTVNLDDSRRAGMMVVESNSSGNGSGPPCTRRTHGDPDLTRGRSECVRSTSWTNENWSSSTVPVIHLLEGSPC